MALTGELYEAVVKIVDERVAEIRVTREMYEKLVEAVNRLAESQKASLDRLDRVESAVESLAEAQKHTEVRIGELAEAQKATVERVGRVESAVERLAEAQKRTEESLGRLSVAVGSLSDTVGYGLEDVARVMFPPWVERHEGVRVEELERRFIEVEGEAVEVNLYGEGRRKGRPITLIGEAKSRIHAGDVKEFAETVEKIRKALKPRMVLPFMFGYWIHPAATSMAKTLRIRVVASYQR